MKRLLIIVALLALSVPGVLAQQLQAGNIALHWDAASETLQATSAYDPQLLSGLALQFTDGRTQQPLPLEVESVAPEGEALAIRYATERPLQVSATCSMLREGLIVQATVQNDGAQQEWIAVALSATISSSDGLSVFDGRNVAVEPQERFGEDEFMGRLQISSAWNADASLGLGLASTELRSWFDHYYLPPEGDAPATLTTTTQLVLEPGQSDSVSFWAASRPGEWGFYESLDACYATWPELYRRGANVDPRVDYGGAQYRVWPNATEWSAEICRRLYAGWEWCYAPFRRTGDIVGRERFWDYEPAREPTGVRAMPREEYLQWRRERFAAGQATGVVMGFYVPSQVWCEEQLAREVYPDALIEDPTTRTLFTTPWVTGHDNERLVFPYRTSFGDQSRIDMAEVVEELDFRAFAFDTAGGRGKYRGPALAELEGRAWDESGVYCRNNIAVARLMQFVHTLQVSDGHDVAVISNPNPNCAYTSVLYSDSMMLEGEPWKVDRTYGDSLRWMAGQKTLTWWEGYGPDTFIDLEQASGEQIAMLLRGLADFTLLQSLRIGYIPPPHFTQGYERLVEWLPALTECVTTGWQPVTAARVPEPIWATRYGGGLDTLIALAHETADTHEFEVAIQNARLAEGALLFTDYDGSERTNRIADGETRVPLTMPTRTPVLLRAQAEIIPAAAVTEATVSADHGVSEGVLRISLSGDGAVTIRPRVPAELQVASARFAGAACAVTGDAIALDLDGQGELEVRLTSAVFGPNDEALLDFPFAEATGPTSTIYLAADAGATEQYLAARLQTYFRYWFDRIEGGDAVTIPVETGAPAAGNAVVIRVAAGEPRVQVEGDTLFIEAQTDEQLSAIFFRYLRALDTKYWTPELGVGASWLRRATGDKQWLEWPEEE
ncbi:MAG: hypothetical protein GX131_08575 [candidate division WS1 bacterium]|nr:hypothetical protein [candidate division WS1 bacterium]